MWFFKNGKLKPEDLTKLKEMGYDAIKNFDQKRLIKGLSLDDIMSRYGTLKKQEYLEKCPTHLVLKDKEENLYSIFRCDEDLYAVFEIPDTAKIYKI